MREQTLFVQFLHPGTEHGFDTQLERVKLWNIGDHKRKYLVHSGSYVRTPDQAKPESGSIAFWGEWEQPSQVGMFTNPWQRTLPTFFHRPVRQLPLPPDKWLQNTDPYVFGNIFRYVICRQFKGVTAKRTVAITTQLRNLQPGSVLLFGSCVDKDHFGLDTVFVVKDYIDLPVPDNDGHVADEFARNNPEAVPDHYLHSTLRFYFGPIPSLRLYIGATIDDPFDGMYSFVPCAPFDLPDEFDFAEDDGTCIPRLPRPRIEIPGVISDRMNQSYSLTSMGELPEGFRRGDSFRGLWNEVVRQVMDQKLVLGTTIDLPAADRIEMNIERATSTNGGAQAPTCSPGAVARLLQSKPRWTSIDNDSFEQLAEDVTTHFRERVESSPFRDHIVRNSIPILFFGNREAYFNSETRIVTVGVNPSFSEFPLPPEKPRFATECLGDTPAYLRTLDMYFEENPYETWFDGGYEKVLNYFDATYYSAKKRPDRAHHALHTDLLSPIATNPIWSKLLSGPRIHFAENGNDFWHRLIDLLRPDIILASVSRPHFEHGIRFNRSKPIAAKILRKRNGELREAPYVLEKYETDIANGHRSMVIWGRKQSMPFQDLGDEQKKLIADFAGTPPGEQPASAELVPVGRR